jgi:hypothetical protein
MSENKQEQVAQAAPAGKAKGKVGRPLKYDFTTLKNVGDELFVPNATISLVSSAHSFGKRNGFKLETKSSTNDTGTVKGILVRRVA